MAQLLHWGGFITSEEQEQRTRAKSLIDSVLAKREAQEKDRLRTAIHEAGHAAMMRYFFGADAVLSACIKSSGAGETIPAVRPKAQYHVLASIYAAGAAAEMKFLGRVPDVVATDHYLDDLAAMADIRKHWQKPGSVTRAFTEAAIAVKEEIFDGEPGVWEDAIAIAHALVDAPDGRLVFLPELAEELEHDRRVKQYARNTRRPKRRRRKSNSFQRLMESNADFWRREGCL